MKRSDKISEHFTFGELISSSTAARKGLDNTPPDEFIPKLRRLCTNILEPVRVNFGKPFRPNSGYRSKAVNSAIGGSQTSQHMKAEAVDIEIAGISNYDLADWIRENLEFDQLILECYTEGIPNSGWVHVSLKDDGENNRSEVLTYSNGRYKSGLHR